MGSPTVAQKPVMENITRLVNENVSENSPSELIKQDARLFLKSPAVSSGQLNSCINREGLDEATLKQKEENGQKIRRKNTFPGTGRLGNVYPFVQFKACSRANLIKDQIFRVFCLRCRIESFPLLLRNLKFAKGIQNRCLTVFGNGDGTNIPKYPRMLDQQELQLYIATDGDVHDISREVSVIMGDHCYSAKTDVTEKCFNRDCKSVTPDQDCSCLILFLNSDETNVTVLESSNVLFVPSPSIDVEVSGQSQSVRVFRVEKESPTCIRRKLTHILGEDLLTYAEEVQQRLDEYEETIKFPNPDQKTMLRNTREAVTVLLNRRVLPDRDTSAAGGSTKHTIPDDIDAALNGMKDSGVMAFGLFADRFVVFIDEKCTHQKDTNQEIRNLCNERSSFTIPVDVVAVSQNFLTDTGLEQGHILKSCTQWGSVGMVTGATKRIIKQTTKEANRPTTSNSEQETHKNTVVAITAGHIFTQNDDAFFLRNGEKKKFGKCLTSLHRTGDTATMNYDIAVIELDENMRTSEDFDVKFRNETGESCDCVVFNGTLASGTLMYKKGAVTGVSAGVVVSQDFRLTGLVDTEKGYLIKGRDDRDFSKEGDSGSVAFTLDVHDEECRTVNLVSIVSKVMPEDMTRRLGIPVTLSYTVRLDKCLEKLSELNGLTVKMPEK